MIVLKLVLESVVFAFHALRVNLLRTFLSLLGISIGIFAIISVFTVVDGLESKVQESVDSLGDNVVYVQKWPWSFGSEYKWWEYFKRPVPSYSELELLQKRTTSAEAMALMAFVSAKVIKYQSSSIENAVISTATHDYNNIQAFELSEGRYFTAAESANGAPIAIIGADVKEKLFGTRDAIGKRITALNRKISIIGVFKKEGSSVLGNSADGQVLMPLNFARNLINLKSDRVNPMIMVKGKEGISNQELVDDLTGAMRSIRRLRPKDPNNFALNETKILSSGVDSIFSSINMAGAFIGGFSILVGGFGIANIMFVSVKERISIIGIQKSLGAKNYFILLQFLAESVVLCVLGGLIGLLIIFVLALTLNYAYELDLVLTLKNIFTGITISAVIGIVSGFIPAYNASRLDPVEAIRSN